VETWTKKKAIDIFEKKFVFIPINKSLHWSLCVVINPGAIIAHNQALEDGFEGFDANSLFPCILFLDSLKAHHDKASMAKNVKAWLNAEWKRLEKSDDKTLAPFTSHKNSLTVYTPKSKYAYSACPMY
jgi:sentrin-specific protease 7